MMWKRQVIMLMFVSGLVLGINIKVLGQQVRAVDLWYPGGAGSYWTYDRPVENQIAASRITATLVESKMLDGRLYEIVQEDSPLVSKTTMANSLFVGDPDPDPFLTFRRNGPNKIMGYGVVANKLFELGTIRDLAEWGLSVKVVSSDDEWVLLESIEAGRVWTVMSMTFLISGWINLKLNLSIEGHIFKIDTQETLEGTFKIFAVEYNEVVWDETDIEKTPLAKMWLKPHTGIVHFYTYVVGTKMPGASLVEHHIAPITTPMVEHSQSVTNLGRIVATWGRLKRGY